MCKLAAFPLASRLRARPHLEKASSAGGGALSALTTMTSALSINDDSPG